MKKHSHNHIKEMATSFPALVIVHKAEDDGYWVESHKFEGCFASGVTVREALHNFKLVIFEYFDVPKKFRNADALKIEAVEIPEPSTPLDSAEVTFVPTSAFALA